MIPIIIIILYLLVHWVADFITQTDKQAKNKSTSIKWLLKHTLTYGLIITLFTYILYLFNYFGAQYWYLPLIFGLIQFVTHTLVDYITSKVNSSLWKNSQVHNFFVMIGFDQFIHYVILFSSLTLLFY